MTSRRLGIGLVGAGEIARAAHLPAYRGNPDLVELRGVFDIDATRCGSLAREAGVPAAPALQDLLEDPEIDLLDIAVPPRQQPQIVVAALKARKHVLAQKPLAVTSSAAAELVELAEARRRVLVVNQQMRWAPAVTRFREFAEGRSVESVEFDLVWPMERGDGLPRWLADAPRFVGLFNSIHFLDTARWLFGEPRVVQAWLGPADIPGIRGESALYAIVRFDGVVVTVRDSRLPEGGHLASMKARAADGLFFAHLGIWDAYPEPSPDLVVAAAPDLRPILVRTAASWVPDAFREALRHVAESILAGTPPVMSGRDNLKTLLLVEACYESAAGNGKPTAVRTVPR